MPTCVQHAAALMISLALTVPCAAQNASPPSTAPMSDPKACSDEQRLQLDPAAPRPADPGNQNLSDKLAQTGGVLCPPNIDPEIKAPTPQGGRMPVIPPPGSPGGDPSVQPK
jgi:hypothetical protein